MNAKKLKLIVEVVLRGVALGLAAIVVISLCATAWGAAVTCWYAYPTLTMRSLIGIFIGVCLVIWIQYIIAGAYTTLTECKHCGKPIMLGSELDLANQGGVKYVTCWECHGKGRK